MRVCGPVLGVKQLLGCFPLQNVNVVEQEKIDKLMLEMDGTENKCEWALCCTEGWKDKDGSTEFYLPEPTASVWPCALHCHNSNHGLLLLSLFIKTHL